jgi:hypothetical protein
VFSRSRETVGCPEYASRLEAGLTAVGLHTVADTALNLHLQECGRCREAMETALLASQLVRDAQRPARAAGSEAFVTRVMAAIREQELRLAGPGTIWRPLERLASRVALVAAVLLLGLSLYVAKFAPTPDVVAISGQTEIGAGLPERPTLPANEDEVLLSLADMNNGI